MNGPALNLNLATRPLRNRRLYAAAVRTLAGLLVVLAALGAFVVVKYGGETSRLKKAMAVTARTRDKAALDERRLRADIGREEKLSRDRVDLVNSIIRKKMFSWTGFLADLEEALPGPSYITALTPSITAGGVISVQMRVTSRSQDDLLAFITALMAHGFRDPKVGGVQKDEASRLISEITATYERPL
jgi:Tfp pilus assembly protein PilN